MPVKKTKSAKLLRLGKSLKAQRESLGITQYELARRCGMHRTFVAGVERGERNVSVLTLLRIADALESTIRAIASTAKL